MTTTHPTCCRCIYNKPHCACLQHDALAMGMKANLPAHYLLKILWRPSRVSFGPEGCQSSKSKGSKFPLNFSKLSTYWPSDIYQAFLFCDISAKSVLYKAQPSCRLEGSIK